MNEQPRPLSEQPRPLSEQPRLEIADLTFAYDGRVVVDHVSLRLWPGRVVGLLGPNGSGKSTLLRLAAGLLRPQRGMVRLEGQPLPTLSRMAIARTLAMVPQHAIMPDGFTGWEVVAAGRTPHIGMLRDLSPKDDLIVQRSLDLVDAAHLAGRRVGELSGGEQQRLLLARALAQEPSLVLLDEPTTHLDLPHQLGILDLMLRIARQQRLAILTVFHDLNLAATYCDEIVLMRDGRFLAHGTPAEILSPAAIEMTYDLRVPVIPHPGSGRPVVLMPPAESTAIDAGIGLRMPDAAALATEETVTR